MRIKKLNPDVPTPFYAKPGDAGFDLALGRNEHLIIMPGRVEPVPTGIAVEIPEGHVGLLIPRSSLGKKHLMLANTVGVIDAGYRGEIVAMLRNISNDNARIEPYERIVQLVVVPFFSAAIEVSAELSDSERGTGGFGSTGQ